MTSDQPRLNERRKVQMQVEMPPSASRKSSIAAAGASNGTNQSILVQQGDSKQSNVHAHFVEPPRERGQHDRPASSAASPSPGVVSPPEEETAPPPPLPSQSGRATVKQASHPRIVHDDGKIHILLGVTGSIHMGTVREIILKLRSTYDDRASIQLILTKAAEKMVRGNELPGYVTVWHDDDEWNTWHHRTDPVIHIELRRWADILAITPCSANTMGKIAMGLCDNLLTNVVRAWNPQNPIFIAPAMVSYAYNNPSTKFHLNIIKDDMKWIEVLKPTEKVAGSYGGIGLGGMMAWNEIADKIIMKLGGYPEDDEDEDNEDEAAIDSNKDALRKCHSLDDDQLEDDESTN